MYYYNLVDIDECEKKKEHINWKLQKLKHNLGNCTWTNVQLLLKQSGRQIASVDVIHLVPFEGLFCLLRWYHEDTFKNTSKMLTRTIHPPLCS